MIEPFVQTEYLQQHASKRNEFNFSDVEFFSANSKIEQSEGIGIILQMVKDGKVDPWNIDIVDITQKYLAQLCELKMQNLRLTGTTLLYAAILLKIKSNVLDGIDLVDFTQPEFDEESYDDGWTEYPEETISRNNVVSIDEVLQRRSSVRLNRKRVVTLDDLIKQLAFYEELDKRRSLKNAQERAKRRVRSYARLSTDDLINNLANEEFIERSVEKLQENLVKIFESEEQIELETLTLLGMDKVTTYLALLFLSSRAPYELVQKEFYGELYVRPLKQNVEENSSDKDVEE